jgi:hypothetical protein
MSAALPGVYQARPLAAAASRPEHLSARLTKKIARFEQIIGGFRQRRWS